MNKFFIAEMRLFSALRSYISLLQPLTLREYSGSIRLFLLTGTGVSLHALGDIEKLKTSLSYSEASFPPKYHVQKAVSKNCFTYTKLLIAIIRARLFSRGEQDIPDDGKLARRLSYNISPHLSQQLIEFQENQRLSQFFGSAIEWQNLRDMAHIEYTKIANMNGIVLMYPRQDRAVLDFLSSIENAIASGRMDVCNPHSAPLPCLAILLDIVQLLYADFGKLQLSTPAMPALSDRPWISDSTLSILPWPTIQTVSKFHEEDAGMISSFGWKYLHCISQVYPDETLSVV